ncbi:MAG: DNA repair protein RadA [Oscillospiraceae bacterium]|nr:DNA repair protein RadA [Oscillospiraceae bacterium]
MPKVRTIFVCSSCGYSAPAWLGKCPECGAWGTFEEEMSDISGKKIDDSVHSGGQRRAVKALKLADIDLSGDEDRYATGVTEFDRVLGGGLVKGALVLIGGDPGIGKSTLILQMCEFMGASGPVLYVSGEESVRQLKMRAGRLGVKNRNLLLAGENHLETIEKLIDENSPTIVIIDSIQTAYTDKLNSIPGSVTQIREVTMSLLKIAKESEISFFIVGHVTKDGAIAGPKVLEHMVDTVLYFEGERHMNFRILRAVKNRFGSTNEIGVFEMTEHGLIAVENPSAVMIGERPHNAPGSVIVPSIEGSRPVLVEMQALVARTSASNPRRMATGVDYNRMTLMVAVLEKRAGFKMFEYDVYVNVTGGLKLIEPASDMGIIASLASSYKDKPFECDAAFVGEIGLTGEVRSVDRIEKRLMEAHRMGFTRCLIPEGNMAAASKLKGLEGLKVEGVRHIFSILNLLMP